MTSKKKKDNYLLQGSILAAAGIAVRLIGLVYRIPLNNILGEEGNGYYAAAFNIYNILLILSSYGMPIAVSKLLAGLLAKEEYRKSKKLFETALLFSGSMGFLFMLIALFGAKFFSVYCLRMEPSYRALMVLAPTVFIVSVMGVIRGFFQGHGNMIPSAVSQIIEQIVNAAVSIIAAYYLLDFGLSAAKAMADEKAIRTVGLSYAAAGSTLGTCLGAFSGLLVLFFFLLRYWKKAFVQKVAQDSSQQEISTRKMLGLIIATMVPIIVSQLVYNISDTFDNVIFGNIMRSQGAEQSYYTIQWGAYSSYFKLLVNIPIAIASSLAASVIPSVTLAYSKKDSGLVRKKIGESIRFVLLIAMPCSVGLGVLADPIMRLLFHGVSQLPAKLLSLGCITVVFYCISTITNGVLQGINHMWKAVTHAVLALFIHLGLVIILLLLHMEIYGIVLGNIAFSLLMCILNGHSITKLMDYHQEWKNSIIKPAFSAGVMGIVAFWGYKILYSVFQSNMIAVIVVIPIAAFMYVVMLGILKTFTEEELSALPKGKMMVILMKKLHLMQK